MGTRTTLKRPSSRELVRVDESGNVVIMFEDLREHRDEMVSAVLGLVAAARQRVRVRVVAEVTHDPTLWQRRAIVTEVERAFGTLALPTAFAGLVIGGRRQAGAFSDDPAASQIVPVFVDPTGARARRARHG